jgi:D-alanine-D-alanine ligase
MKVLVLHNPVSGASAPDDLDTLAQVRAVDHGLQGLGHQVETLCFDPDGPTGERLLQAAPDAVFNLVESVNGSAREAHKAPALLEELGIPFTGAASEPFRLSTSKLLAKAILSHSWVPTPEWHSPDDARHNVPLSGDWLVKSVWEHASLGLEEDSVVAPRTMDSLRDEMLARRDRLGGECFAEAYIHGREFNISLLQSSGGVQVLPLAELRFLGWSEERPRVVGYRAKWQEGSPEYRSTVRSFDFPFEDSPLLEALTRTATDAWTALGLSGYARVDLRVDSCGRPLVIDVNANPCIAPDAGFAAASSRAGLTYARLLERILMAASDSFRESRSGAGRNHGRS